MAHAFARPVHHLHLHVAGFPKMWHARTPLDRYGVVSHVSAHITISPDSPFLHYRWKKNDCTPTYCKSISVWHAAQTQPDPSQNTNPNPNPNSNPNPSPFGGLRSAAVVSRLRRVFRDDFPKYPAARRQAETNQTHGVQSFFYSTDNANRSCCYIGGVIK